MTALAADPRHVPVLIDEVVDALAILPGERHVDATFGAGGYTRAMLAKGATVFAFDRDPDAIREGETLVRDGEGRLALIEAPFSAMESELAQLGAVPVDGVTMDIGVSSMQLDRADRAACRRGSTSPARCDWPRNWVRASASRRSCATPDSATCRRSTIRNGSGPRACRCFHGSPTPDANRHCGRPALGSADTND